MLAAWGVAGCGSLELPEVPLDAAPAAPYYGDVARGAFGTTATAADGRVVRIDGEAVFVERNRHGARPFILQLEAGDARVAFGGPDLRPLPGRYAIGEEAPFQSRLGFGPLYTNGATPQGASYRAVSGELVVEASTRERIAGAFAFWACRVEAADEARATCVEVEGAFDATDEFEGYLARQRGLTIYEVLEGR